MTTPAQTEVVHELKPPFTRVARFGGPATPATNHPGNPRVDIVCIRNVVLIVVGELKTELIQCTSADHGSDGGDGTVCAHFASGVGVDGKGGDGVGQIEKDIVRAAQMLEVVASGERVPRVHYPVSLHQENICQKLRFEVAFKSSQKPDGVLNGGIGVIEIGRGNSQKPDIGRNPKHLLIVISEEKQLVSSNGPSNRSTELLLATLV